MLISVVVCTHNRSTLLREAYRHNLRLLARHPSCFEVIFVLSGCSDDSIGVADRLVAEHQIPSRVVVCDEPGLSIARNAGMHDATGDYFWFLDDDVFLGASWAEHVIRSAATHDVVGGRTLPYSQSPSALLDSEAARTFLSLVDLGCSDRPFPWHQGPVGANFGFSRAQWVNAGRPGFDAELGRVGAALNSGEEVAFLRALRPVRRPQYIAQAAAFHWIDPVRFRSDWWDARLTSEAVSLAARKDRIRLWAIAGIHGLRGLFSLNPYDRRVRLTLASRILQQCQ